MDRPIAMERRLRYSQPIQGSGRQYQGLEAERCVHAGLLESPATPLDESVRNMQLLDETRRQIGVRFPMG